MNRKLFILLLTVVMISTLTIGCVEKKTAVDVNPVLELTEEKEEENNSVTQKEVNIDESEDSKLLEIDTVEENIESIDVFEEKSILDEPLPETLSEVEENLYTITDGQLLFDYMNKVAEAIGKNEISYDVEEWFDIMDRFLLDLENNNPELLDAFNNAELPE